MADKSNHLGVRHSNGLVNLLVRGQKFPPAAVIAYEKLTLNQFMASNFVSIQKALQRNHKSHPVARERIQTDVSTRTIRVCAA